MRVCGECKGRHVHYEVGNDWECIACKGVMNEWNDARKNYKQWLEMRDYGELLDIGQDFMKVLRSRAREYENESTIVKMEEFLNEME